MSPSTHDLGVTCRCVTDDLKLGPGSCDTPVRELSHPVAADFVKKRSASAVGQEVVQELAPSLIAYSLHTGQYRSVTWHHERLGVVWLLASAIHRADDRRGDAYPRAARLHQAGRLVPQRDDVERHLAARVRSFADSLRDIAGHRNAAIQSSDRVHEIMIGGRVAVRVYCESGELPLLSVAVTQRLLPGEMQLPQDWFVMMLAAFFPSAGFAELEFPTELAHGIHLRPGEVCVQHFAKPSIAPTT